MAESSRLMSIIRRGAIVREVTLRRPAITLVRQSAQRYSISDLIEGDPSPPPPPKECSRIASARKCAPYQRHESGVLALAHSIVMQPISAPVQEAGRSSLVDERVQPLRRTSAHGRRQ
jgi:hypothetical protein